MEKLGRKPVVVRAAHFGRSSVLTNLVLVNLFLSIITFGFYSFWGKVTIRKYLWNSTELNGSRFSYHGTAGELALGYLVAAVLLLSISAASQWHFTNIPLLAYTVNSLASLSLITLLAYAQFASQAYLLSKTSWRSIRFSMAPAHFAYIGIFLRGLVLSFVTLGLYFPIMSNELYRAKVNNSQLGDHHFHYNGSNRDVFMIFLTSIPKIFLSLGLYYFWYRCKILRYRVHNTWLGAKSGASHAVLNLDGLQLMRLYLVNSLLILGSLGLALPLVMTLNLRFITERIALIGQVDFDQINQLPVKAGPIGHGIATALDLGVGA